MSNYEDGTVSVIDTATRQVVGSPITIGPRIEYLTPSPDGSRIFVAEFKAGRISAIDTASNQVVGTPVVVGKGTGGIAVVPDQSPSASFSNPRARPGVP